MKFLFRIFLVLAFFFPLESHVIRKKLLTPLSFPNYGNSINFLEAKANTIRMGVELELENYLYESPKAYSGFMDHIRLFKSEKKKTIPHFGI